MVLEITAREGAEDSSWRFGSIPVEVCAVSLVGEDGGEADASE